MLDAIINYNIKFLQKHGVRMENEDDKDVYRYGLQVLYGYIINVAVLLLISACYNRIYETALMIFVFAILQVFGGGYHADTKLKCLFIMILGSIIGNIFINIIINKLIILLVSTVILSLITIMLVPVINENHPVSKKTFIRSAYICRTIILGILLINISLLCVSKNIESSAVVVTLYLYLISLTAAKIKNKK